MALIQCYECSKEISENASACPHCGAPAGATETPILSPPVEQAQQEASHPGTVLIPLAVYAGVMLLVLVALMVPSAAPLIGMFCFGNLMRECGVVERLSDTTQNTLINIVTIFLGLAVGSKLRADQFLIVETLGILALGIVAFGIGTAAGVLMAKLMNLLTSQQINPLIGAAGVSAVPMAARVASKVGLEANPNNFLLMHAMGPNVAGVIGSAVIAGVFISLV